MSRVQYWQPRGWVLFVATCTLAQVSWTVRLHGMCEWVLHGGPRIQLEELASSHSDTERSTAGVEIAKWLPTANKSDRLEKSHDIVKNAKLWNVSHFYAVVIFLGTMFKWKVSGLGGKKEKAKTQQQQPRLNNEPSTTELDAKNNKTKENNKKDK